MKILLHIGRQKTGTTSIQRYLLENSEVLDKAGYYYSHEATHRREGHHKYAELLLPPGDDTHEKVDHLEEKLERFNKLFSYLKPDKINIISTESFQNCDPEIVKAAFTGHEVKVVCYIRCELDSLVSSYVQKVHASKLSDSMEEYIASTKLDYHDFLTQWSSAFGSEFSVRIFDKKYLHDGNVICDFFHNFLHIDAPEDATSFRDHNPSLTNRTLAFKLQANARGKKISRIYRRLSILSKYDTDSGKVRMTEELKHKIKGVYIENQKKWAPEFFSQDEVFDYEAVKTGTEYDMGEHEFMEHMSLLKDWTGNELEPKPNLGWGQRVYRAYRILKGV